MTATLVAQAYVENPMLAINRDSRVLDILSASRTMTRSEIWDVAVRVITESEQHGLDPLLMVAIIRIESNYNHLATSPVGAEGLMQLLPPTARDTARRTGYPWPEGHSFDPVTNVTLGIRYYAYLLEMYGGIFEIHGGNHTYALTAYNRGPHNTDYILAKYGRLPGFVLDFYANKVLKKYKEFNQEW